MNIIQDKWWWYLAHFRSRRLQNKRTSSGCEIWTSMRPWRGSDCEELSVASQTKMKQCLGYSLWRNFSSFGNRRT